MNITRENWEGQTAIIKVTVSESDYSEQVDKTLRQYRRKANVPGFRPGMVPMGIINKMYRKGALAEEAYKIASQGCFDYLKDENIEYVGDVMPSDEQGKLDFDNDKDFDFLFEIGIAPQVNIELSDKDTVERYKIKIDDAMYDSYRTNFMRRYGRLVDVEAVENDEAITGTLDNDEINVADAYVGLISMNEEQRKPFIGKKPGDVVEVNVNEIYPTASQRAAILQVKEEELEGINPQFKLTIDKIRKFAEPELNEEFYKMAFLDGSVTDEKALDKYFKDQIARDLDRESEYMFTFNMRKMLLDKAALSMPEEFLKRWLFAINEGKFTMEQIEADFPQFLDMMKWNLIQKYFADKFDLKVTPEEALEEAKGLTLMQFAQYGMMQVEDEMLSGYAQQILTNKEEARKIYDKLFEKKVISAAEPLVKVKEKKVSMEEFGKIAEKMAA